jgi:hypothetical protein
MWSFDMSRAPRGSYDVLPAGKDKRGARKQFRPDIIIVAGACGTVTLSHFIPDARRWEMFTRDVGPIAWMPYDPKFVEVDGEQKRAPLPAHPTMKTGWFEDMMRAA